VVFLLPASSHPALEEQDPCLVPPPHLDDNTAPLSGNLLFAQHQQHHVLLHAICHEKARKVRLNRPVSFPSSLPPPQPYLKLSTVPVVAWTVPRLRPVNVNIGPCRKSVSGKLSAVLHFPRESHTDAQPEPDLTNLVTYRPPCRSNSRKIRSSRRVELAGHRAFPR
jgi:hypothetical protein